MEEWEEQSEGSFVPVPSSLLPAPVILIKPLMTDSPLCDSSKSCTYCTTPIWGLTIQESYTHFIIPQKGDIFLDNWTCQNQ